MSNKKRNRAMAGLCLVLLLLAACGSPTAAPATAAPQVATLAAALATATTKSLATGPAASAAATPGPRSDGLLEAQAKTLDSLAQVDDYPLYTMTYYGAYDVTASASEGTGTGVPAWACSLFTALAQDHDKLYGRNFDWRLSPAMLLFAAPPDGYASVSMVDIGYLVDGDKVGRLTDLPLAGREALLDAPFWPFDGMNEMGLAIGMAAVPDQPLPLDPDKEAIGSLGIIREMLDHAGNVDEALEILQMYNLAWDGGPALHYLIADPSGEALLVEFYKGEMVVLPNEDAWHLATNHLRSEANETGSYTCQRYDRIQERLAETAGGLGSGEAMELLSEVAQQNTQWSVVYGMDKGTVYVAMGKEYDVVHSFELSSMGE